MRVSHALGGWTRLAAGAIALVSVCSVARSAQEPPHSADLDAMIIKAAKRHGVPEQLVRRVVMRESRYNPRARNHSFWGLMQISYPTAKSMGFKGTPQQLLNPMVNLTYAVPYLANAFVIAGKQQDAAVRLYAHGYYDAAKHRGLLGVLRTADSAPVAGFHDDPAAVVAAQESPGFFGSLFGSSETAGTMQPPAATVATVSDTPAAAPVLAAAPQVAGTPQPSVVASESTTTDSRHGGVTVLSRGEQGVEHLAAYAGAPTSTRLTSKHHTRKSTDFASLEPPASAQAYAATVGAAATATPPQAAISQALAEQAGAPGAPMPQPTADAAAQQAAAPVGGTDDTASTTRKNHHRVAAKKRAIAKAHEKPVGPVAQLRP